MAISTYHSGESVLHRAMVGRLTQASVRGWGSALGSVNTGNHVSRNTACIWLVKAPGVKQPTIEVAAVAAANFNKARWPAFLEDMTPPSAGFSMATMNQPTESSPRLSSDLSFRCHHFCRCTVLCRSQGWCHLSGLLLQGISGHSPPSFAE